MTSVNTTAGSQVVSLLQRKSFSTTEQWIFPHLTFTCYGQVTEWVFRGVPPLNGAACRVHITTWRLDPTATFTTQYNQVSTTENNVAIVSLNASYITYKLSKAIQVQPQDIVGIETGFSCPFNGMRDNILSLNISGSGTSTLSYSRPRSGTIFFLSQFSGNTLERDLIPLIAALVFGKSIKLPVICSIISYYRL